MSCLKDFESTSRKSQRTWAPGPMCGPALLLDLQLATVQVERVVSRFGSRNLQLKADSLNSADNEKAFLVIVPCLPLSQSATVEGHHCSRGLPPGHPGTLSRMVPDVDVVLTCVDHLAQGKSARIQASKRFGRQLAQICR